MERLAKASAFMVGCGAIGCELLKNLALLGFASGASQPFVAGVSSNNSNYATSSPSNDEASITTSRSEDDEDDEEELAPLIIRDIHQMAMQLTYLGSGPGVNRIHQSDHGDTGTVLETPLQAVPPTVAGMSIWRTAQSPSATRGAVTATPTNVATEALTAIAGPKGEPAAGLGAGEEYAFRGSPAPSSSATYYRLDEGEILRLPMITLINSYSDYDADVESMAQQTFSFSPPTVTTATATTNTDANTNNANYDGPCITVTDMDHIEKSNLNRQFLFRPDEVGQAKSTVAARSIQQFNPALKVVALQRKLDFSTEKEIFTDEFLQTAASGRDKSTPPIVLAALDSVEARRYLDARCVTNRLAMFESGTQGTKGHTQVVLPGITESYSSQSDPSSSGGAGDGDAIPYCTLKSFPAKAADCVEWAREKFFAQFSLKPRTLDQLLRAFHYSPKEFRHALQSLLTRGPPELSSNDPGATNILLRSISTPQVAFFNNRPTTWEECIRLGREKFEKYFHHKALHLLHKFPADKVLEGGEPFWQLPRRKPRPITFDLTNDLHVKFVWYFGRLLAKQMDIQFPSSIQKSLVEEALTNFTPEPYIASDKEVITDPFRTRPTYAASETVSPIVDDKFQALLKIAIARLGSSDCKLVCHPVEFDKDNDNAGHIDFITAATNLRSAMYGILETDRYEVKRIAGRIIPAMATTTAAVAGLVSLEVLKYICFSAAHPGPADFLATNARNNFLNLSLPSFIAVQPGPSTTKFLPNNTSFTIWDRWEMELPSKSSTLKQFIGAIKSKSGLDVSLITQNCRPIYMTFLPKFQFNLNKPMLSLLDIKPLEDYVDLVIAYEGANGDDDDVEGPPFRLKIPST